MAWDMSFKKLLAYYLRPLGVNVLPGVELPLTGQRIDFVLKNNSSDKPTPFKHAREVVVGEFKSNRDRLAKHSYYAGLGMFFTFLAASNGYLRKTLRVPLKDLRVKDVSFVLVLGGGVRPSDTFIEEFGLEEVEAGILRSTKLGLIDFEVLLIDELSSRYDCFRFAGLYGSSEARRETILYGLRSDDILIKSVAYFLYGREVLELSKAENIPFDEQSISIRDAVLTLGIKRVIDEIGLKAVIDEIGLKAVIDEIGVERVVEELLKSDPDALNKIEKIIKEKKKSS